MAKFEIFISGTQDDMKAERKAVDCAVNVTTLATGILLYPWIRPELSK